jgi:tetratricopeptide (TPR) repeat protein
MKRSSVLTLLWVSIPLILFGCETEVIRKQQEEIRQQEAEIKKLRQDIEEENDAKKMEEQRAQACNVAFRSFEKAQAGRDSRDAVALYREGLKLCPDDDVAHYELGKILAGMGRSDEARAEFAAALKINPTFQGAKQELEKINRR